VVKAVAIAETIVPALTTLSPSVNAVALVTGIEIKFAILFLFLGLINYL
jgi:hypothetical protein